VAEVRETGVVVGTRSEEKKVGLFNGLLGDGGVRYCNPSFIFSTSTCNFLLIALLPGFLRYFLALLAMFVLSNGTS